MYLLLYTLQHELFWLSRILADLVEGEDVHLPGECPLFFLPLLASTSFVVDDRYNKLSDNLHL